MDGLHVLILLACLTFCSTQFEDELQSHHYSCLGDDKFQCMDGTCIDRSKHCDGNHDCSDLTDEDFCSKDVNETFHLEKGGCRKNFVMCKDGKKCIPVLTVCNDEVQCEDASDEANCDFVPLIGRNESCKGFMCRNGKCISRLWMCDGQYDCDDKSDEDTTTCSHSERIRLEPNDGKVCDEFPVLYAMKKYRCLDSSFCINSFMMCDGLKDCRDGSDEGPFCKDFHTMCSNFTCHDGSVCYPDRDGPKCLCSMQLDEFAKYNYTSKQCEDVNDCVKSYSACSQICINQNMSHLCQCEEGYFSDTYDYLCYAPPPEAKMFFSTIDEIRYVTMKTKQQVVVVSELKQVHGVAADSNFLYWVETAEGHQVIYRAQIGDIEETKEVLVSIGLEDPGDIALDWLGEHIYFDDAERGIISVCRNDGSICKTLKTNTRHPKFVTLDPKNGKMYWADWHKKAVIMTSRMDGSQAEQLTDNLDGFPSGLTVDAPNDRLYFADRTIKVIVLATKKIFNVIEETYHNPYSVVVFENTIYWNDWATNTIQSTDKVHGAYKRHLFFSPDAIVYDMTVYHPVMMNRRNNPCANHTCSQFCLVTSNVTHVCACKDGMRLDDDNRSCVKEKNYHSGYLIVAGGSSFTKIEYGVLGNPEAHGTHFDIGRVQAMAYDSFRENLYIYDGQRQEITFVHIDDFEKGDTQPFIYTGLVNVVDMDYDYVSDCLYILDAGRRFVEVVSLKTQKRILLHRFTDGEIPISMCVIPEYGRMMVALVDTEHNNELYIYSLGLDGTDRKPVILTNLKGPHIRLRYSPLLDNVYFSDEGNRAVYSMHPEGTGRQIYRDLLTSVTDVAVAESLVFWVDRRTSKIFWSTAHESTHNVRRMQLSMFPNNTQLHLQVTPEFPDPDNPLMQHRCFLEHNLCSDVCVQTPHPYPRGDPTEIKTMGYKCLCPPGLLIEDGKCEKLKICKPAELFCHKSNTCVFLGQLCDGVTDCDHGEDEENCPYESEEDNLSITSTTAGPTVCSKNEVQCKNDSICIARAQFCDGFTDCPDNSDEETCETVHCLESEFKCSIGSCIPEFWRCDGDIDCTDGTDELDCVNSTCSQGYYQCRDKNCIEMKKRCDGQQDCFDFSDEDDCEEVFVIPTEDVPKCADWEFACELDKSICLPFSARCNERVECPGASDESDCQHRCPRGSFRCMQERTCVYRKRVCDGRRDCADGSDETPDACASVNRTSKLFPTSRPVECHNGYLCENGECVEWWQVCNMKLDCSDGTDEQGQCETACVNNNCSDLCRPTPVGPHCYCASGYRAEGPTCVDIDECADEACSQGCQNVPGSFLCSCHHGYALRSDRVGCKAVRGDVPAVFVYVSGGAVRALAGGRAHADALRYAAARAAAAPAHALADIDVDHRRNKLFVTDTNKLVQVNATQPEVDITNIGRPTKVAVDWVTGNVYFVDSTPTASYVRVCNFSTQKCAKLQKLPYEARVTAFIVDPSSRYMFYCLTRELESVVWLATLDGRRTVDLASLHNCTGLAVDSFRKRLYVAETKPSHIIMMNYEGDRRIKLLTNDPHLQAPHNLAIFEDHIYFLVGNSFKLVRCTLFGEKYCEPYMYRAFEANTFVIQHESVQRNDLPNICERSTCENICVLGENGPQCLCPDGFLPRVSGKCREVDPKELPHFYKFSEDINGSYPIRNMIYFFVIVLVLLAAYGIYKYYRRIGLYYNQDGSVRYRSERSRLEEGVPSVVSPTVEMLYDPATPAQEGNTHMNPFMRYFLSRFSLRKRRPTGTTFDEPETSGITGVSSPTRYSETESSRDFYEAGEDGEPQPGGSRSTYNI